MDDRDAVKELQGELVTRGPGLRSAEEMFFTNSSCKHVLFHVMGVERPGDADTVPGPYYLPGEFPNIVVSCVYIGLADHNVICLLPLYKQELKLA